MTTLKPALAYPVVTGLRFIPIPILICVFLTLLSGGGFSGNTRLRPSYLVLGSLGLLVAAGTALSSSGAYRIWQSGLPIRWTLLAGESFILAVNAGLFALGYRFFNSASAVHGRQFLKSYGTAYLLIVLTAAIIGRHWNEINTHHLATRMPQAYRVGTSNAEQDLRQWLEHNTRDAGPDLRNLSTDPEFLRALKMKNFYRHDFDEALQISRKAVIFGYEAERDSLDKRSSFIMVRFPAALASQLRFEMVRN